MFKTNRVLIRIILSHLVSGALLTAFLLIVVSSVVTSRIEAATDQSARTLLRQTYQTTYAILTDVYGDFYTLWTKSNLVLKALDAKDLTPAEETEIGKLLASTALNDEAVFSVQIIDRDTDKIYSDRAGPTSFVAADDPGSILLLKDFALHFDEYKSDVFFPRTIQTQTATGSESIDLLSIIFAAKGKDGIIHSGMIVNIDRKRLARLINLEEPSGQLLMIGPSGKLIAALSGSAVSQDYSSDAAIRSILSGNEKTGSFNGLFMGEKTFLIYQKADTLGFTFIRTIPYSVLTTEAQKTNNAVAGLFIAAMIISLLISAYATWQIYRPLNRLVTRMRDSALGMGQPPLDEYAYLHAAYSDLSDQNRQSGLIRLIHGQIDETSMAGLRLNQPRFLTLAIMPDQTEKADAQFISRIYDEAEKIHRWHVVISAPDCVSVVLNEPAFEEDGMEKLITQISGLQQSVRQGLGTTVSVGLGTVVEEMVGVRVSHRYALIAVQYALALGENQLVPYGEIENTHTAASQNRTVIATAIDTYILHHLHHTELTPEEIANHIGLSVGYMRQLFRMERGIPINDYITTCRISKAQNLLSTTNLTAKKISEEVGYVDSRYFYTLFKKKTGETTEEYRLRMRQSGEEHGHNDV